MKLKLQNMTTKLLYLFDALIEERCELYGIRNTICWFIDEGLTKEDLLLLDFDEADIDYVIANPNEDYDYC